MARNRKKPKDVIKRFEKAAQESSKMFYVLRLFVTGMTPRSQDAIENVRALCEEHLKGRYQLNVVDIRQHPLSASENQIIAAPTLIKKLPLPLRKFVGDMTKTEKILAGLDIKVVEKNA
jgi:circadian clock protein KaiB